MSVIDFEQDAAQDQVFDIEGSKALSDQIKKLQDKNNEILATEEKLKELNREADKLSQEVIPTMMQEMNYSTLKLNDGSAVEIKPFVYASIPADKKDETDGHKLFKKEIEMFVKKIKKEHKSESDMAERIESCSNDRMFQNLLKLIEDKDDHEKMPVRKFFNNTFGTLLNDAIFALMKKQEKSKSNAIFTMQGSVKFVA